MPYFRVQEDGSSKYTGNIDAAHKWHLPGIFDCPACKTTWSDNARAYPSVDLTPISRVADFEQARAEPVEEYERLCELVRPFLSPGFVLKPGAALGPLVGKAWGRFGPLVSPYPWWLLMQRAAFEQLQAEGVRGLEGCRPQLRFRQRAPPELLELELLPIGLAHSECLPTDRRPRCARCGRRGLRLPQELLLDAATLPTHLDVFRLEDFSSVIVCTERLVEACQRLGLDGVSFHALRTK